MPPLLLLQDIALTFGVAPLLSGAGLAVATGDRISPVGRSGSGIAAGLVEADAGERKQVPPARRYAGLVAVAPLRAGPSCSLPGQV